MTVTHMPPRGRYLANEVGQLAGVSGQTIGQWARQGYIRSSQSAGRPRVYSFQDVGEAMVVHELLNRGATYPQIREHIERLRERYGVDWPLTQSPASTGTVGGTEKAAPSVVARDSGRIYGTGSHGWQQQVEIGDLNVIANLLWRGGWAARDLPDLEHIEVNPDRLSGRPTIRGHRIAAEDVAEIAQAPEGPEILRDDYELSDAEIRDAVRWWDAARRYEAAA